MSIQGIQIQHTIHRGEENGKKNINWVVRSWNSGKRRRKNY